LIKKEEIIYDKNQERKIVEYSIDLSIILRLLKNKLINEKEYEMIKKKLKNV